VPLYFRTGGSSLQVIVGLELGLGSGSASFYNIEEHITSYKVQTKYNR